jgi:cell wall-associated NlpC family hydrolase
MMALAITVSTFAFASEGTFERSVYFRSAPSTDSNVYSLLKTGTMFQVLERVNSYWIKISAGGKVGYVSTNYVSASGSSPASSEPATSEPASGAADRIIEYAKNLQGFTHYDYGVNSAPSVMDCSAFTKYVFGKEGITLRWGTRYQKDAGSYVSKSNLQKGDLVFFGTSSNSSINHVGIYIGSGQLS